MEQTVNTKRQNSAVFYLNAWKLLYQQNCCIGITNVWTFGVWNKKLFVYRTENGSIPRVIKSKSSRNQRTKYAREQGVDYPHANLEKVSLSGA